MALSVTSWAHGVVAAPPTTAASARAQVDRELLAQGLSVTLPTGVTGEIATLFGTRFVLLKSGGDSVFVGRRTDAEQKPCSLDTLTATAKSESGFTGVVRSEIRNGVVLLVSSHHETKDQYLVQACAFESAGMCGAEKLADLAAADRVAALCATLRVGSKLGDVEPRVGRWVAQFVDGDAAGRAAGRGGGGDKVRATITISRDGIDAKATYAVGVQAASKPEASAELNRVRIVGDAFSADPIAVKTAWPLYLPARFEGRFTGADTLIVDGKTYHRKH